MRFLIAMTLAAVAVLLLVRGPTSDADGFRCAGSLGAADSPVVATERIGPCVVHKVVDGDTLDVLCSGGRELERIRMLKIDTPELEQPGNREATRALRELLGRSPVHLILEEPDEAVRGRYGRLLAYVFVGDRNLNVEMVRLGWSSFDTRFGKGRFSHSFIQAEKEARQQDRGLWSPHP